MDLGLRDRVYIVSGASRGLGHATAAQLVADGGGRVVLCSREESRSVAAAQALGGPEQVVVLRRRPGRPGCRGPSRGHGPGALRPARSAVVSVGGPPPGPAATVEDDTWRAAFESASGRCGWPAPSWPPAADQAVTFVLSSSVRSPIPGLAISNGLRPGLAMAAKTLADEYGPQGSRVNVVLPGRIDTDRVRELDEAGGDPEASRRRSETGIPAAATMPEDFAR